MSFPSLILIFETRSNGPKFRTEVKKDRDLVSPSIVETTSTDTIVVGRRFKRTFILLTYENYGHLVTGRLYISHESFNNDNEGVS